MHPTHWLTCAQVTKYLVYNMRKRQEGGDKAKEYECGVIFDAIDATHPRLRRYFNCTQSVAGVQDTRFQALMPDVLHWLGITKSCDRCRNQISRRFSHTAESKRRLTG